MIWHRLLCVILFLLTVLFCVGLALVTFFERRIVTFESRESKSPSGIPVLNEIRLRTVGSRQFWQMRQFHQPSHLANTLGHDGASQPVDFLKADFVEISLHTDIQTTLRVAEFRQFQSGEFEADKQEIEYSVSCGICHTNGPRLIRPQWNSSRAPLSAADMITILFWNLRIKLSGPVHSADTPLRDRHGKNRLERKIPLHLKGAFWEQPINIEGCNFCHGKDSRMQSTFFTMPNFLRRHELRMENLATARHLFNEGSMPPPLHGLNELDRQELDRLLKLF